MLPLYTFTLDPDSLVPERTSAVSSVVLPLVSAPVTVPTLSVAELQEAVGDAVSPVTAKLLVALLVLPARSVLSYWHYSGWSVVVSA